MVPAIAVAGAFPNEPIVVDGRTKAETVQWVGRTTKFTNAVSYRVSICLGASGGQTVAES